MKRILLLFLFPVFLHAQGVYVSFENGDDENHSGLLPEEPLFSIQKAVDLALSVGATNLYLSGDFRLNRGTSNAGIFLCATNFLISGGWDSSFLTQSGPTLLDGSEDNLQMLYFEKGEAAFSNAGGAEHVIWMENCLGVSLTNLLIYGGGITFEGDLLEGAISNRGSSDDNGGGIFINGGSSNQIFCVISNNYAPYCGGGICLWKTFGNRIGGKFIGNSAGANGGGLFFWESHSNFITADVTQNSSGWSGGGFFLWKSHVNRIASSVKINASAVDGGGLCFFSSVSNRISGSMIGNLAAGDGGGAYFSLAASYNIFTRTSVLVSNYCVNDGGGISAGTSCVGLSLEKGAVLSPNYKNGGSENNYHQFIDSYENFSDLLSGLSFD